MGRSFLQFYNYSESLCTRAVRREKRMPVLRTFEEISAPKLILMASMATDDQAEEPHVGVTAPHLIPKTMDEQLKEALDQANNMNATKTKNDANDYSRFDALDDPDEDTHLDDAKGYKEEGNRFFKMRNYYEAIEKYTEVVNVLKTKDEPEEVDVRIASLSNRAACHLKLRNFKDCIKDCDTILKKDKQHTKALFRRAQAHKSKGMNELAYRDILLLLDVDGANKSGLKEKKKLEKDLHSRSRDAIRSRIEKEKRDVVEKARKKKEDARKKKMKADEKLRQEERLKNMATSSSTATISNMAPPAKVVINKDDIVKDTSEESGELMRGYKKTKDGKTTSYFTRELDDKAKALLGDTAPKRLDQSAGRSVERKTSSTSAWNSAGTYEERDRSQFCTNLIKEMMGKSAVVVDTDTYTVNVTGVKKVEGEGSMVSVRGSLRFIWDYSFSVNYKVLLKANNKSIKGSLSYVDFTQNIKEPPVVTKKIIGKGFKEESDKVIGDQGVAALEERMESVLGAFSEACKKELEQ